MKYQIEWRKIERFNCPGRELDGHIKNVEYLKLGSIELDYPISENQVLVINGKQWIVDMVIHILPNTEYEVSQTILRVVPFSDRYVHTYGSDSWRERIPLFEDNGKETP